MKLLLMADSRVGYAISRWLLEEFREDVALVVVIDENRIQTIARNAGVPCAIFSSAGQVSALVDELNIIPDVGISAWWPKLIKRPLLNRPRLGFINTHPSLLPHNRGKHYNFWALVEQAPFGVSLHMIDEGIDSGDVIAQRSIPYDWEDNGETLYGKAEPAMVKLFQDTYPSIRTLDFSRQKQDLSLGSFHKASELDPASCIELDREYLARDLLNLLRARTFSGYPSCWFCHEGREFEVRVQIRKKCK
jgi:methionyl-tRNA formyltransferase